MPLVSLSTRPFCNHTLRSIYTVLHACSLLKECRRNSFLPSLPATELVSASEMSTGSTCYAWLLRTAVKTASALLYLAGYSMHTASPSTSASAVIACSTAGSKLLQGSLSRASWQTTAWHTRAPQRVREVVWLSSLARALTWTYPSLEATVATSLVLSMITTVER